MQCVDLFVPGCIRINAFVYRHQLSKQPEVIENMALESKQFKTVIPKQTTATSIKRKWPYMVKEKQASIDGRWEPTVSSFVKSKIICEYAVHIHVLLAQYSCC